MELLVGIILPPVIDYLNRHISDEQEKFIVAVLTCLLVAIGVDFNQIAQGDARSLPLVAGTIFSEASIIYTLYWKNSLARNQYKQLIEPKE